jgi:hypothetical protein
MISRAKIRIISETKKKKAGKYCGFLPLWWFRDLVISTL